MRLPELHRHLLADILHYGSTYRLVLAGGYAIQAHRLVSRTSFNLDLATDAPARMEQITGDLVAGLEGKGWAIRVIGIAPRMARILAADPVTGRQCEVDIFKEIFHRPPVQTEIGPALACDDAVGLKMRALHDRGFPHDVIDVFSARELYSITELEHLGAQHDEEFDLAELRDRLEAVSFTSDEEFAACDMPPEQITELRTWVQQWQEDLGLRLAEPYEDPD